ncbi:hypothetical protein [Furfurilactobacillus milii]|uniref:Uncharacterized protein n=1 Tax=Furfurilactobacillus milii TaxID=2888272 RepID=A0A6N9I0E6_9LACO|nr:hypothetical protein [Furfurilactobacillus milii]MYV16400.1 hypothetical protein [Furfurilactobacillus milii]
MKHLILSITTLTLALTIGSTTINAATAQPVVASEPVNTVAQSTTHNRPTNYYFSLKDDLGYR